MKKCNFNETIVITDPCHIVRENADKDSIKDWGKHSYGERMSLLLKTDNFICESTICGDWSCTCWKGDKAIDLTLEEFNKMTEEERENMIYGQFCADSGQVIVVSLKDVIAYNPDFLKWAKEHRWCVTLIEDFVGTVEYCVGKDEYSKEKEEKYGKEFMETASRYCYLRGEGNKQFITSQTIY